MSSARDAVAAWMYRESERLCREGILAGDPVDGALLMCLVDAVPDEALFGLLLERGGLERFGECWRSQERMPRWSFSSRQRTRSYPEDSEFVPVYRRTET